MAPGMYAAGDVTGIHDLQVTILQGKLAGLQAVTDLAHERNRSKASQESPDSQSSNELIEYSEKLKALTAQYKSQNHPVLLYRSPGDKGKRIVCICEDVTEKDMKLAVEEGFDDLCYGALPGQDVQFDLHCNSRGSNWSQAD
jgi:hypothetical protein